MTVPAVLALEDGTVFRGTSIGAKGKTIGEVVFNTSMTGYQEILTDPSYCRQIITMTCPHIGNTGVNSDDFESGNVYAAGLIVRDLSLCTSSWRADQPLADFLKRGKVVAIAGIDTRRLTRLLRDKGAQSGCIMVGDVNPARAVADARKFPGLKGMDLARFVTTKRSYQWNQGSVWPERRSRPARAEHHVAVYDFGIKRNILRLLADKGCRMTVVPATTSAADVLALKPDGVVLSNGPGDPEPCDYAIRAIRELLAAEIPLFGICLGHQLLALASGARTVKMKFGHHGANHPVVNLRNGQVSISTQNHGFAVDADSLPANVQATHRSLFDGTLQGIELTDCPAFGFQGHPEAGPGPHDLGTLYEYFVHLMENRQAMLHRPRRSGAAG
ncbi:MAG TPA: glutamine-hydrolyzing carbamoyl-phosphate synthase small subunit [Gammaproteobacteria bacterium]|nr:glutamine-hydrolyzing carbamoyl-phosphate synthase small subunit [Gammaproteobacteria bacterium]